MFLAIPPVCAVFFVKARRMTTHARGCSRSVFVIPKFEECKEKRLCSQKQGIEVRTTTRARTLLFASSLVLQSVHSTVMKSSPPLVITQSKYTVTCRPFIRTRANLYNMRSNKHLSFYSEKQQCPVKRKSSASLNISQTSAPSAVEPLTRRIHPRQRRVTSPRLVAQNVRRTWTLTRRRKNLLRTSRLPRKPHLSSYPTHGLRDRDSV